MGFLLLVYFRLLNLASLFPSSNRFYLIKREFMLYFLFFFVDKEKVLVSSNVSIVFVLGDIGHILFDSMKNGGLPFISLFFSSTTSKFGSLNSLIMFAWDSTIDPFYFSSSTDFSFFTYKPKHSSTSSCKKLYFLLIPPNTNKLMILMPWSIPTFIPTQIPYDFSFIYSYIILKLSTPNINDAKPNPIEASFNSIESFIDKILPKRTINVPSQQYMNWWGCR